MEMFVYFDDAGDIISIGPCEDASFSNMPFCKFPLEVVSKFLEGKASISTHKVVRKADDSLEFEIVSRKIEVAGIQTIGRFLTEVTYRKQCAVKITNNISKKQIVVELNKKIQSAILGDAKYDAENASITGTPEIELYFTAPGDPSFLFEEILVSTNQLLSEGTVVIDYESDISQCGLFTKKIFETYSYKVVK